MSLEDIGRKNFTEKISHGYLPIYEKLWKDIQNEPITLLEIGIYNGNSMRTWCEWFPNATVVGIDHNSNNPMQTDRAKLHFGKQENVTFLEDVAKQYDGFDIVIDDGSHQWDHQQITLEALWEHVKPGGMYIVEDLHTSTDKFWAGEAQYTMVEYLKAVMEFIVLPPHSNTMKSIEFYNKIAIIHKSDRGAENDDQS